MKPLKVTSDLLNVVLYTVFQRYLFRALRPMFLLFIGVIQSVRYVSNCILYLHLKIIQKFKNGTRCFRISSLIVFTVSS